MDKIKIVATQFEHTNVDKVCSLPFIDKLPKRAFDNGIHIVFPKPIRMNDAQSKDNCLIFDSSYDSYATTIAIATATILPKKLSLSGAYQCKRARKPELYESLISESHKPRQKVIMAR